MILLVLVTLAKGSERGTLCPLFYSLFVLRVYNPFSEKKKKTKLIGDVHGVKICRVSLFVSHLMFVDDCFLFYKAFLQECLHARNILLAY